MADRLDTVGGTVTVGSEPGSGTTVTALVPMLEQPGSWHSPIPVPDMVA